MPDPILEKAHQVDDLLGVVANVANAARVRERRGSPLIAARGAAEPEVDAARVEELEHAEVLGHLERTVVGQHDAAAAHANVLRARGDLADQDLGTRRRDARQIVVLGNPEAPVAEGFGAFGEFGLLPTMFTRPVKKLLP